VRARACRLAVLDGFNPLLGLHSLDPNVGKDVELFYRVIDPIRKLGVATVLTDKRVVELALENGRCTGVVTDDGETYLGRDAVVSTIHVKSLVEMAPADAWGEDFLYGIDTFDVGISSFAQYYATTEARQFVAQLLVFSAQGLILRHQRLNQVEQLSDHLPGGWVGDGIKVDVGYLHTDSTMTARHWIYRH